MDRTKPKLPEPTLRNVIGVMAQAGIDHISLVRTVRKGRKPAIGVLMLSQSSIQLLGPVCLAVADRIGKPKGPDRQVLTIDIDTSLERGFQWCEQNRMRWSSARIILEIYGQRLEGCYFVALGDDLCAELAPKLTALGCPTTFK